MADLNKINSALSDLAKVLNIRKFTTNIEAIEDGYTANLVDTNSKVALVYTADNLSTLWVKIDDSVVSISYDDTFPDFKELIEDKAALKYFRLPA
ncbi:hypothetical protein LFL96_25895 [Paraburkholderia sp. D15]|uniref:hypothetical protein n=1 Tax=Paraburkholderia sp. D15 TaxID=2880218 RepID=UPI00247B032E|nr:hypothetical protein [Paraburkholderia sp. D15]WGS54449.1 hypothetical protein LFL96_25895 [Paraburkholderia sp. D15]